MPLMRMEIKPDTMQYRWAEIKTANALAGFAPKGCPELPMRPKRTSKDDPRLDRAIQSVGGTPYHMSIKCNGSDCSLAIGCPIFLTGILIPALDLPEPLLTQ